MTFRNVAVLFPKSRGAAMAFLSLLLLPALPACATATIEDAVPQGAVASEAAQTGSAIAEGPIDTGAYPNLNIPPVAETEQLTAAERTAKTAELLAARAQVTGQAADVEATSTQPLETLARNHGEEVLREIEGDE